MTTRDTRPCKPPVEGHYKQCRNGLIFTPIFKYPERGIVWDEMGRAEDIYSQRPRPGYDIVATFSPEHLKAMTDSPALMSAVADGRVGELMKQARYLKPYLIWTIGPESPVHHPTLPSMVSAFIAALTAIQGSTET